MKLIISIFFLSVFSLGFSIPKKTKKQIDKEILSVFGIESFSKEELYFDEEINKSLLLEFGKENFYRISDDENQIGYFYYGNAWSKVDTFDYLVIFDNELIIKKIKILAYREDYGGEIGSKRWLKQFNDLSKEDTIVYGKDIKAISGATISARSMTIAINELLQSIAILQNKNQL